MKYGKSSKKNNRNLFIRLYFIFGSAVILLIFVLYSNFIMRYGKNQAKIIPSIFAHFVRFTNKEDYKERLFQYILHDIVSKIEYPIIVTNDKDVPLFWKNIGVEEGKRYDDLPKLSKKTIAFYLNNIRDKSARIPLYLEGKNKKVFGYVYYDEPLMLKYLRFMPYIEMSIVILFILFGLYVTAITKKNEKDMLWVGLARETAHQFGTPISSLIAWMDLLKYKVTDTDNVDMIDNMKADVIHLQKVANRFGKVGSTIKLSPTNLHNIIEEVTEYFSKRLPNSQKIEINFISKIENTIINIDPDLIRWTLENLIKNAIDAMKLKGGNIILTAFNSKKNCYILVRDEGAGIPKSKFSKIFDPGETSKSRGWGLGLSLAKRIIEDYHGGKIKVLESTVNKGTTFEIALPGE